MGGSQRVGAIACRSVGRSVGQSAARCSPKLLLLSCCAPTAPLPLLHSAVFKPLSTAAATACSTLSAVAVGSSLAAYFAEAEASRDPAWLTAAILAGLPILYSMLVRRRAR